MVCSFQGAFTSTSVLQAIKNPTTMAYKPKVLGWNRDGRTAEGRSKKFKAGIWWTGG